MKNICSLGVHNQVADEEPAEAFNLFWVSTSLVAKRVRSPKLWCSLLSLRYVAPPTVVTRRRRERKRQKSRSRRWYAMVHCCAPCCSDTMCSDGFAKSENTGVDGRIRLHEDQAGYQKFHSLSLYFWICQLPDGKPSLLVCFFAYRSYRWGDWPFLSASQWTSDGEANIWPTSRSEAPSICAQLSAPAVPPALPCYRSLLQKKTCLMTFSVLWRLWVWLSDCLLLHHSYHSSWFLHLKDFLVQQSLDAFAHQASPQGFLRASRPMSSMFAFFLVEFGKDTAEDDITEIMFEVWARSNVF